MSYKDLKQPLAGDAPTMSNDELKSDVPANDPAQPETDEHERDAQNNEHGSGHGHSDAEKKPM